MQRGVVDLRRTHAHERWVASRVWYLACVGAYVYLQSLAYHIDIDETLAITNYQANEEGQLCVGVAPCDATGRPLSEDMFVSNPTELLGTRMDLLVKIPKATGVKWVEEDPTRGVRGYNGGRTLRVVWWRVGGSVSLVMTPLWYRMYWRTCAQKDDCTWYHEVALMVVVGSTCVLR